MGYVDVSAPSGAAGAVAEATLTLERVGH